MGGLTDAVKHLLIINVLFFVATQLYQEQMVEWLALWFPANGNFHWWQAISHMFMHGGFMHILFNMYGLWAFGTPLERMWGRNKFLFFYFSAGIGAALLHTGVNYYFFNQGMDALINAGVPKGQIMELVMNGQYDKNWSSIVPAGVLDSFTNSYGIPAVGASGAIYGILVAFAFMYSEAELMLIFLPIPIKAKYFVPLLIAGEVFFGFSNYSTGIAHFAHIGGALVGFIMMWYWKKRQFDKNRWN
jgi:membrane associated rhomboid family serine protease